MTWTDQPPAEYSPTAQLRAATQVNCRNLPETAHRIFNSRIAGTSMPVSSITATVAFDQVVQVGADGAHRVSSYNDDGYNELNGDASD